jgi:hypothetical protein
MIEIVPRDISWVQHGSVRRLKQKGLALPFEFRVLGFESVGDVLQEDETKDDVLVLRRVHVVAERICHAPELRFIHTDNAGVTHVIHLC